MDHAEIKHLIPLKALSRLDGDEARAVDDHLAAGCDECERELASFTEALAAMAIAESGGDGPSDRIWSRLQARLEADRPPPRLEDRSTREPSRGRGFAMLVPAAIAAVIAIAVSTALFNWRMRTDSSDMSNEIAALTARVVEVQRNLDTTGDQLAALEAKVAQNTDLTLASLGPDSQVVRLAGLPASPSATGSVALNRTQGTAMLQVSGLPPTPDDKVYEVWWIGEKLGPLKAGLFEPLSHGATIVSLDLPPPDEVVLASAITLEPSSGVEKPTGAMYMKGDFPRR
ncbi:anti-sigma factor domain-containing protein [Candidatus Binatus sp.]|uniref:anti-sigma factor domain-containing protein n=1 Tax=Candidatus Binatus sp. TaxID=2811406 RepID=UPI003CC62536